MALMVTNLTKNILRAAEISINSSRSYIRNFWEPGTRLKGIPGQLGTQQTFFSYGNKTRLRLQPPVGMASGNNLKRLRRETFKARMKYKTGRMLMMEKILKGERYLAEV